MLNPGYVQIKVLHVNKQLLKLTYITKGITFGSYV